MNNNDKLDIIQFAQRTLTRAGFNSNEPVIRELGRLYNSIEKEEMSRFSMLVKLRYVRQTMFSSGYSNKDKAMIEIDEVIKEIENEKGNYTDLPKELNGLTNIYNGLSKSERDSCIGQVICNQIKAVKNQLKEQGDNHFSKPRSGNWKAAFEMLEMAEGHHNDGNQYGAEVGLDAALRIIEQLKEDTR
jgi:hypothetical protein